jgi:huntingtin-interacting protein 1-related protein
LEPLRIRYEAQHHRLVKFYFECSNLRYLTSLITVPKLPLDPPHLLSEAPRLPMRPKAPKIEFKPEPKPEKKIDEPDDITEFWKNEQLQQQQYAEQQRFLEERQAQQLLAQQQAAEKAQRDFEEQQRQLAEQQRLEQEAFMEGQMIIQQQAQHQAQQQVIQRLYEVEQENFEAKAHHDRDLLMLQQYDQRVKSLEVELQQLQSNYLQQIGSKDEQIKALQGQVNTWRAKYEALAKLYSQLRTEHLDLLNKFKNVQLKASSAQEAIDKKEKLEREVKTKNLELADMIRERDRALNERNRAGKENDMLAENLRAALEDVGRAREANGTERLNLLTKANNTRADLKKANARIEDILMRYHMVEEKLQQRDDEVEILRTGMDQTLIELNERENPDIMDAVLQTAIQRVDDALYEFDSNTGNLNATPSYVLSQIEKASNNCTEFATAFGFFITDKTEPEAIRTASAFAGAICDVLTNVRGLQSTDQMIRWARQVAYSTIKFLRSIQSFQLDDVEPNGGISVVNSGSNEVQVCLFLSRRRRRS